MTIDDLRNYGADVDDGMNRCMNNEAFYLKMIGMALNDEGLKKLKSQLEEKNLDGAFETAHALKGVFGNLALTPIYEPINEMTELLRSRTDTDYTKLMNEALDSLERLKSL